MMMNYPTKAEKWERPSGPDGDGNMPGPAVESIKANTEKPTTHGGAVVAKAENTEKADASAKAENGSSNISQDQAKAIESRKAENILAQILQQSAANLSSAGVRVAVSDGMSARTGDHIVRLSIYNAHICEACNWIVIGDICYNRDCSRYGIYPPTPPPAPVTPT